MADGRLSYSFTGGRPSPEDFPARGLSEAAATVLEREGRALIDYPGPGGQHQALQRVAAARYQLREGNSLPPGETVITPGSSEAISELTDYLAAPGDTIITEELTYMGSLGKFRSRNLQIVGIPVDPVDGMDMDILESTLARLAETNGKPKFIYTIASYQNPTGSIMPRAARERLVEVAARHAVPIIEDDCYGDVHLTPEPAPPTLYGIAAGRGVAYVGSFSKVIGPGLRLGYTCVPEEMRAVAESGVSNKASGLASMIVAEYLASNLRQHLERHVEVIVAKRDVLMETLAAELGSACTWRKPRGGLFCWIELPAGTDTGQLATLSARKEVEYSPGRAFHVADKELPFLRLSYTHMSHAEIREGVRRLATCIRAATD